MRTRVQVAPQVEGFVRSLAPEPRRSLTIAIKALADDRGDIKRLEGKLEEYCRLRVAGHRANSNERSEQGDRVIDCVFAEKRSVVYDLFIRLLGEGAST